MQAIAVGVVQMPHASGRHWAFTVGATQFAGGVVPDAKAMMHAIELASVQVPVPPTRAGRHSMGTLPPKAGGRQVPGSVVPAWMAVMHASAVGE